MKNLYHGIITNQESKQHLPNHAKPISTDLLSPLGVTYNKEQNLINGGEDGTLGGGKVKVQVILNEDISAKSGTIYIHLKGVGRAH